MQIFPLVLKHHNLMIFPQQLHQLFYLFCVDKVKEINGILLSHVSATKKLSAIDEKLSDKFPTQLNSIISKIQEELRISIKSDK